jgi:hypothetical protein
VNELVCFEFGETFMMKDIGSAVPAIASGLFLQAETKTRNIVSPTPARDFVDDLAVDPRDIISSNQSDGHHILVSCSLGLPTD